MSKPSDIEFETRKIHKGYPFRAAWRAVLKPILGSGYNPKDIPAMLAGTRRVWHRRITALRQAGWKPVEDRKACQYFRNCPPFGVVTDHWARPCGRSRICPFCWARGIAAPLAFGLLRACFEPRARDPLPDVRLLEFCYEEVLPTRNSDGTDFQPAKISNLAARISDPKERYREVHAVCSLGSFLLHTIRIREKENQHVFTRAGVLIVGDTVAGPASGGENGEKIGGLRWTFHETITRPLIVEIVSRVAAYPASMLTCAPKATLAILWHTRKRRTFSFSGMLGTLRRQDIGKLIHGTSKKKKKKGCRP